MKGGQGGLLLFGRIEGAASDGTAPHYLIGCCIYHGHGLFLQFFGFFRSVKDLFTSAYYAGNQAVKQEASL